MKKLFIILFLTLINVFPMDVIEHKLPKSSKVIVKLVFRNGSIADPAGKEGLTFLTANLMSDGGTGNMSYSQIQDKIYPMAALYNVSVDKEVSIFTFQVHVDWLDKFYEILKGIIVNPLFDENDFQRIKNNQQVYVDKVIRSSSDEEYSKKALEDLLFRGSDYQHLVQGSSTSISSLTLQDVKDHYKKYFTRNNLTIGIAGNYSDAFLKQLKTDMGKLSDNKPELNKKREVKKPNGINVEIIVKNNASGSAIYTGLPMNLTRKDDDFAALMVANSFLGEHRKSYAKLYQQIREVRSMNYGDYSYIEWYDNGGAYMLPPSGVPRTSQYFALWLRPVQLGKQLKSQYEELKDIKIGHAHFALRMALYELDKMIKNGMSKEDFEDTRTFLRSYIKLYVRTPAEQLGYKLDSKFYGRKNWIEEVDKQLASLTLEDVNKAIKKYWSAENMYVTIVTDKSEAENLKASLEQNITSPMAYSNLVKAGLPEAVLNEDKTVADFKLNVKSVKLINSDEMFK